jgi:hypothetical protein
VTVLTGKVLQRCQNYVFHPSKFHFLRLFWP